MTLKDMIQNKKPGTSGETTKDVFGPRNVPDKNLESMDNIFNKDNQTSYFHNINNKENDSELANNFD